MPVKETLIFNPEALSRMTARRALLRREVADRAGLSLSPINKAYNGRPVSVVSARKIASALRTGLADLLADELVEA